MLLFKDYLENLNKFAKEFPEALKYQVIYSHDDEGNEYQRVIYDEPSLVQLENPNQESYRFLERVGNFGEEGIKRTDCNAVIIN